MTVTLKVFILTHLTSELFRRLGSSSSSGTVIPRSVLVVQTVVWEARQGVEVVPLFVLGLCKAHHVYGDVEFVLLEFFLQVEFSCVLSKFRFPCNFEVKFRLGSFLQPRGHQVF